MFTRIVIFLISACICTSAYAQRTDSLPDAQLNKLAATVKAKYAPDHRSALFTVSVKQQQPLTLTVESTDPAAIAEFESAVKRRNINLDIQLLPAADLNGKIYGISNLSVCNNRLTPRHAAEMVTQMTLGTPVDILKKQGGWFLVRSPEGYLSWTDGTAIAEMDLAAFNAWQQSGKVIFTDDFGIAYQKANTSAAQVSDLIKGNILQLVGRKGKFAEVRFPDGRQAFVPAKQVADYGQWLASRKPTADNILASAKTMLGVPYLWGGTSVKGVDCSGFTKTSYYLNGVVIPRDASQQALAGMKVDISVADTVNLEKALQNLRPGDLLFFTSSRQKNNPNPRITHTAIYMGEGQFIQSAGMVRINSMVAGRPDYDDYQTRSLVSARRFIDDIGKYQVNSLATHPFYQQK